MIDPKISSEISTTLKDTIPTDGSPLVIYSALWPFVRHFKKPEIELAQIFIESLLKLYPNRTLLFPTFTNGFVDGVCDLDATKSTTGILSEEFRETNGVRRTICPFFSFAAIGKHQSELINLKPKLAWGEGSLYEWIYKTNATIITIGLHPTHCSFTHYAEAVNRDLIPYRTTKTFNGKIIHEGKTFDSETTLLVRDLNHKVINDFTWLMDPYLENGMVIKKLEGIGFSAIKAKTKIDLITSYLKKDNLCLIKK